MAILDVLCKLSAAQQVTADAVSGNCYDSGNTTPKRKLPVGEAMAIVVCLKAVGTNTGSAKFQAVQSATEGLGSGNQIIGEIDAAAADLVAGARFVIPLGHGIPALRYYGANYDITGTVDFTVDAYLMPLSMVSTAPESYPSGYTIS